MYFQQLSLVGFSKDTLSILKYRGWEGEVRGRGGGDRDGHFSFRSFIVRDRPVLFVFFSIVKKMILFVLKITVNFPSISFVFSLSNRLVNLFNKTFRSVKNDSYLQKKYLVRFVI